MIRLEPELAWIDGRFRTGTAVTVDASTGRIVDVATEASRDAAHRAGEVDEAVVSLPSRALIPGFVNAHSHAFQRLIRGRTQWRPRSGPGSDADFWSWRDAMYGAALRLDPEEVHAVARFCFLEMMRTGITTVGEFHYLHHTPDGRPYPNRAELAFRVIAAAEEVGLRITLLNVCYATGGIDQPPGDLQRRFISSSPDAFLEQTEALLSSGEGDTGLVSVGIAPHSLRAVPRAWLPDLRAWAVERDLPVHMHVAEQPAEIEACVAACGLRPVELLAEDGLLDERFTAVHATHLTDTEVERLGASGATVCACPTTERDLGDGFLRGLDLLRAGAPICLGTDSHTTLDFLEEMRLVEYHERLRRLRRVVIADERGDRCVVGPSLLEMATGAGARALRLDTGSLEAGRLADLVAVDLTHPSLAGSTADTLDALLTLSATPDVISDVWVGGVRRIEERRHALEDHAAEAFRAVAQRTAR